MIPVFTGNIMQTFSDIRNQSDVGQNRKQMQYTAGKTHGGSTGSVTDLKNKIEKLERQLKGKM